MILKLYGIRSRYKHTSMASSPKLMFQLPHYNLSNRLLSTITIFCMSLQSRDSLRDGRPWNRIPVAARFSAPV